MQSTGVNVVCSQLSGRCGILDDSGERSAVLDQKGADQCGETGVLVGRQRRHTPSPIPDSMALPTVG
jgi:hypothetical protein